MGLSLSQSGHRSKSKKKETILRDRRHFRGKFASISDMKVKLRAELGELLPQFANISVGYYEGRQSLKKWLITQENLDALLLFVRAEWET